MEVERTNSRKKRGTEEDVEGELGKRMGRKRKKRVQRKEERETPKE